jgi:hypothetical protein
MSENHERPQYQRPENNEEPGAQMDYDQNEVMINNA